MNNFFAVAIVAAIVAATIVLISESYVVGHCEHTGKAKVGAVWIECKVLK